MFISTRLLKESKQMKYITIIFTSYVSILRWITSTITWKHLYYFITTTSSYHIKYWHLMVEVQFHYLNWSCHQLEYVVRFPWVYIEITYDNYLRTCFFFPPAVLRKMEYFHFLGFEDLQSAGCSIVIPSSCVDWIAETRCKPYPLDLVRCSVYHMVTEDDLTRKDLAFWREACCRVPFERMHLTSNRWWCSLNAKLHTIPWISYEEPEPNKEYC